jgi:hypothetical protein
MQTGRMAAIVMLGAMALGSATGRSDDARPAPPPGAGFLEFLGSVDRLSETNPDYLSQADPVKPAKPAPAQAAKPAPPSPPPPPSPSGRNGS